MKILKYISIFDFLFVFAEVERGFLTKKSEIRGYFAEGNDQEVKVIIRYPFRSENVDQYDFEELENCFGVLNNFSKEKIQARVDQFFKDGRRLLEKQLGTKRVRKQAVLIGLGAVFTSFLYDKSISVLSSHNKVEITSDEHLKDVIRHLSCSITYDNLKFREIKDELKSKKLTEKYFENIREDLKILQSGKILNSNVERTFMNYCTLMNTMEGCKDLLQYGAELSHVVDFGFENLEFNIHIIMKIPHLIPSEGYIHEVDTFFIPVMGSNMFKRPLLESIVIFGSHRFYKNNCNGDISTFFICKNPFWEFSILDTNFEIKYVTKDTEDDCVLEITDKQYFLANKIIATISVTTNATVTTATVNPGLHIFSIQNSLITCGAKNFKVFTDEIINTEVNVENHRMGDNNVTEPKISYTNFSIKTTSHWSTSDTIGTLFIIGQITFNIMIFFRKYLSPKITVDDSVSLKSLN